ncbi:hypothetical protein GCM10010532_098060 [Dactylosporangium siamense]|uniref:Uncharacterized protein n=1 Tax=Dactylosporangium siamense TaxID=685454 RepID=A0A919PYS5_9ACTN|nr:hypothetical protein Dsi01nite_109020 [Dactylosporangium siamense]
MLWERRDTGRLSAGSGDEPFAAQDVEGVADSIAAAAVCGSKPLFRRECRTGRTFPRKDRLADAGGDF